jgi:hypothetical protein
MGLQNRSLSSLLQGDFQTLIQPPLVKSGPSGIKVLENVKLSSGMTPKLFSNNGKMIDMSKVSVINAKTTNGNSLVLLPDGKIKNLTSNVKVSGGRYITSKRQLLGNKPPKPVKKISYISQPCSLQTATLPPPTNLTTQDIMDLPIIFADDNQILDSTLTQPEVKSVSQIVTSPSKLISANTGNKFMLINKPNNFIISPTSKTISALQPAKVTPKYTKIILSSKRVPELSTASNLVTKISPEISVKKVVENEAPSQGTPMEELDLENEIAASTLYKIKTGVVQSESSEMIASKPQDRENIPGLIVNDKWASRVEADVNSVQSASSKRTMGEAEIVESETEMARSKILKLDSNQSNAS